jgi:hypothetical protein
LPRIRWRNSNSLLRAWISMNWTNRQQESSLETVFNSNEIRKHLIMFKIPQRQIGLELWTRFSWSLLIFISSILFPKRIKSGQKFFRNYWDIMIYWLFVWLVIHNFKVIIKFICNLLGNMKTLFLFYFESNKFENFIQISSKIQIKAYIIKINPSIKSRKSQLKWN